MARFVIVAAVLLMTTVAMAAITKLEGTPSVNICSSPGALLQNIKFDWSPRNVKPGDNVTIRMQGDLTQSVGSANATIGGVLDGLIPLGPYNIDVCDLDKKKPTCPIAAGTRKFEHSFKIPSWIPSGSIAVNANLWRNSDMAQIVCLNVTISL